MDDIPPVKDKNGNQIELLPIKVLKFKWGQKEVLDRVPMYSNIKGDWFVEKRLVQEYLK
jgi:hypothetical protein